MKITVHSFPGSLYSTCTSTHTISGKKLDRDRWPLITVCLVTGRIHSRHKTINAALKSTDRLKGNLALAVVARGIKDHWMYDPRVIKLSIE